MNSTIIGAVFTPYGYADIVKTKYRDGNLAILLIAQEDQEPIAVLSINLPKKASMLGADEVFVKAWSENEQIAPLVLLTGLFEDTGKRVPTGFVEAQVWRVKEVAQ